MVDLSDIGFIKRIVVGSTNAESMRSEQEVQAAMELVNRCLTESPRGKLIGIEKNFNILHIGEHQIVLQSMVYHIGFTRKPPFF